MLDEWIRWSIKNKLWIGIFTLLLIFWGISSLKKLPFDALPDITNNQFQIITVCPNLAAEEVEILVTLALEKNANNLPQLEEIRSVSRLGLSVVTVVFSDKMDPYLARQLLNEKIQAADISPDIGKPELAPLSTGLGEIFQYLLLPTPTAQKQYTLEELRTWQDFVVAKMFNNVPGVAEVNSFGGKVKQYQIGLDPEILSALEIDIIDIWDAVTQNNQNSGAGYMDINDQAHFIRGIGMIENKQALEEITITKDEKYFSLKEIAKITVSHPLRYGAMSLDGEKEVVGGTIMLRKGENSQQILEKIHKKIPEIEKALPKDLKIISYLDRSELINRTLSTVSKNLLEGAIIVIFVLIVFLGNWRAGWIVASVIPLCLLFALGMMQMLGLSGNLMSLGALDFGLLVDGSIIIVEACLHHLGLRENKGSKNQQQMDQIITKASIEIRHSAAFGEIIILIVYLPLLFLAGIEGKMFQPMAQTVMLALLGAFILSLTYVPMMSALFLSKSKEKPKDFSQKILSILQKKYRTQLKKALRNPKKYLISTLILLLISLGIFSRLGGEFMPQLQEGDFAFHCILPTGSSLEKSIEVSMQASKIIKSFPEVKHVIAKTGTAEIPTDPMPMEASDLIITLKDPQQWPQKKSYEQLAKEILEELEQFPGIFFEANQPIQMRFNELLSGIRQDIAIKIFGENLDTLSVYAQKIQEKISNIEGVSNPQIEVVGNLPQIKIDYNRKALAQHGISINQASSTIEAAFMGKNAGFVIEGDQKIPIVIRLEEEKKDELMHLEQMPIYNPQQIPIPLHALAQIKIETGVGQISHEKGKRRIFIGLNAQGTDTQALVEKIKEKIKEIHFPEGYYLEYGGNFENFEKATHQLQIAVPLCLFFIFILLYLIFRNLKKTGLIFTAIPLSAIGGIFALFVRQMPFSIAAGIGFIALFGIAVLNGIVLLSTFNQLEKEGFSNPLQQILRGTHLRLRPVLMTATVAALGFLPMAISTSAGAEIQRPLATVVMGGLISATFLTLFILPILYLKIQKNQFFTKKYFKKITFFCFLMTCFAQASPNYYTLEMLLEKAEKNNLELKTYQKSLLSTQKNKYTAGDLPKTNFSTQLGQYSSNNFDYALSVGQNIPFPGTFDAKRKITKANVAEKKQNLALAQKNLKKNVTKSFYKIIYLQKKQQKWEELEKFYEQLVKNLTLQNQIGEIEKIALSSAKHQAEMSRFEKQYQEQLLENTLIELQFLIGSNEKIQIDPEQMLPALHFVLKSIPEDHPFLMLLDTKIKRMDQEKKLSIYNEFPELVLGYTNQSMQMPEENIGLKKRFHFGTIGLNIPLNWAASFGKTKTWAIEKEIAVLEQKWYKQKFENDWKNTFLLYEQNKNRLDYFEKEGLNYAKNLSRSAQTSYQNGKIDYIELFVALQNAQQIELDYLTLLQTLNEQVIELNFFTQ